jgi:hypothetical protein
VKYMSLAALVGGLALFGCNSSGGSSKTASTVTSVTPATTAAPSAPAPSAPAPTTQAPATQTPAGSSTTTGPTTQAPSAPTTTSPTTSPISITLLPPGQPTQTSTPASETVDSSTPSDEHMQYAIGLINASRAQYNLNPVVLDAPDGACALRHASDCEACANGSMSNFAACAHKDFIAGDTCTCSSENQGVAGGPNDPAFAAIHQAMMSEGPPPAGQINHFWVITNPTYTSVALGEFVDSNGVVWISEEWK